MEGWGLICFQNEPRASRLLLWLGTEPPSKTRWHLHLPQAPTCARSCSSSWVENSVRQCSGTSISATISPILCCMATHSSADKNPSSTRNPSSWNYRQEGAQAPRPQTSFTRTDWTSPPNYVKAGPSVRSIALSPTLATVLGPQ